MLLFYPSPSRPLVFIPLPSLSELPSPPRTHRFFDPPWCELFIYLHEEFKSLLHHCRVHGHFLFADMCARKEKKTERGRERHPEAILLDDNKEQPSILPFPVNRHLLLMESLSRIPSLWIRVSLQLTWRHIAHALPFLGILLPSSLSERLHSLPYRLKPALTVGPPPPSHTHT